MAGRLATGVTLLGAGLALCGCAGADLPGLMASAATGGIAGYTPASHFYPVGYSSTQIDATHHKVQAVGTEGTPRARLEKIAMARAAEIGVEERLAWFKVEQTEGGVRCTQKQSGYKGPGVGETSQPMMVLTVAYAQAQTDASYQAVAPALDKLKAELQTDPISPDDRKVAAEEARAQCTKR